MKLQKAVFLDRDGTLIVDKIYLNDPEKIEYLPDVFLALQRLRDAGFVFFVATNQSGVPRGLVSVEQLTEIHRRIQAAFRQHGVEIKKFYYAPHLTDSNHFDRKPNPGMLFHAAKEYDIDLGRSWMIGDRMIDVEAGHRAGTRSILLQSSAYADEKTNWPAPEGRCANLLAAADTILSSPSCYASIEGKNQ